MEKVSTLHKDIKICSDKYNSTQGSVFYCHQLDPHNNDVKIRGAILKIYHQQDLKSYIKEVSVFNDLEKAKEFHL